MVGGQGQREVASESVKEPAQQRRAGANILIRIERDGKTYLLDARFLEIRLTPEVLWYGANLAVRAAAPEAPGEPPLNPPPAGPGPPEPSAAASAAETASSCSGSRR